MSVHLLTGDDEILVAEALAKLTAELVGDADRALALSHIGEDDLREPEGDWSSAALVDAARTPPFLSDRRVIVGRNLARFSRKQDYGPLVSLIGDMLPTIDLVLVWERGRVPPMTGRLPVLPRALRTAVEAAGGEVLKIGSPTGKRQAREWLRAQLAQSDLRFDRSAEAAVADLIGQDGSRIVGLLLTLEGALGSGAFVTADDVAVYGGDPGSVAPWDLDDAIDRGDITAALTVLHRQLQSRHPFQMLAGLHGRYQRMLRLDGSGAADEREAAKILAMKGSTFPARKLLHQTRRLGPRGIARAVRLLAEADLALRGAAGWPNELVLEVLVVRLANLARGRPRSLAYGRSMRPRRMQPR